MKDRRKDLDHGFYIKDGVLVPVPVIAAGGGNPCHGEDGRFCETHNDYHGGFGSKSRKIKKLESKINEIKQSAAYLGKDDPVFRFPSGTDNEGWGYQVGTDEAVKKVKNLESQIREIDPEWKPWSERPLAPSHPLTPKGSFPTKTKTYNPETRRFE